MMRYGRVFLGLAAASRLFHLIAATVVQQATPFPSQPKAATSGANVPRESVRGNSNAVRAAVMNTLIQTAKLNDINPEAWLADVLARIADMPLSRLGELLPWNWRAAVSIPKAA